MTDQELLDFYAEEKDATFRIYRARAGKSAEDYLELQELIRLTRLVIDKEKREEREKFIREVQKEDAKIREAYAIAALKQLKD